MCYSIALTEVLLINNKHGACSSCLAMQGFGCRLWYEKDGWWQVRGWRLDPQTAVGSSVAHSTASVVHRVYGETYTCWI
jgi:hypothetical protein